MVMQHEGERMELIETMEEEISLLKKASRPVNVRLSHVGNGVFKGVLPFKVEGDYIISAKGIDNQPVVVEYHGKTVSMEIDTQEQQLNAFLSKDESLLLEALKKQLRQEEIEERPSFIIGPPGTGKTKVIGKIVQEAIKNKLKILVVSPTNMAVENVFERIDLNTFEAGEVVLTIKTDLKPLQQHTIEGIKRLKLKPLEDEGEVLEMAKQEVLRQKKQAQPDWKVAISKREAIATKRANIEKEIATKRHLKKEVYEELKEVSSRIKQLTGNVFVRSVAEAFMRTKVDQLKGMQTSLSLTIEDIQSDIDAMIEALRDLDKDAIEAEDFHQQASGRVKEADAALVQIKERIKVLEKELNDVKSENFFEEAKIVGATLINASLGKKIQAAEFDIIIVDEASMALYPSLVVVSQALNNKKREPLQYTWDESLYDAQNQAVEMAINSRFVCVGDPKQLHPIAKKEELKKDVFAWYGADAIFEEEEPENTVLLDKNFRNHPHITALASKMFYAGLLKSAKEDDGRDSLFVRTSTSKMVSSEGSFINYGNMKIVVSQIKRALERGRRSIGVITPYKKQALLIEENIEMLLQEYPDADIQCGTIHTFQGKEKEIIIFDITFSPDESKKVPASYNGDMKSNVACLLNVAMTRAQDFFIVVGDIKGISKLDRSLALTQWVGAIEQADNKRER